MGKKTFAHYLWWTDTAAGVTASYAEVKSEISGKKGGSCKGFNDLETVQAALKIKKCEFFGSELASPQLPQVIMYLKILTLIEIIAMK